MFANYSEEISEQNWSPQSFNLCTNRTIFEAAKHWVNLSKTFKKICSLLILSQVMAGLVAR